MLGDSLIWNMLQRDARHLVDSLEDDDETPDAEFIVRTTLQSYSAFEHVSDYREALEHDVTEYIQKTADS